VFRTIKGFLEKPWAVCLASRWMVAPCKCQNLKFSTVTKFPVTVLNREGREPLPWLLRIRSAQSMIKESLTFKN
jgi:hypothetical protein